MLTPQFRYFLVRNELRGATWQIPHRSYHDTAPPRRDAVATTVELLAQMIGSLPLNEDTEAALNFLKQSDLTRIIPTGEEAISSLGGPYHHCVRQR